MDMSITRAETLKLHAVGAAQPTHEESSPLQTPQMSNLANPPQSPLQSTSAVHVPKQSVLISENTQRSFLGTICKFNDFSKIKTFEDY